jgi:hypothetical protein
LVILLSIPWRGSTLDHILPLDLERLLTTAPQRIADLDALTDAATALRQKLCDDAANSLASIRRLLRTVDALLTAPELDQQAAANLIWTDHRYAIKELADHARAVLEANEKLRGKVTESAWILMLPKILSLTRCTVGASVACCTLRIVKLGNN